MILVYRPKTYRQLRTRRFEKLWTAEPVVHVFLQEHNVMTEQDRR